MQFVIPFTTQELKKLNNINLFYSSRPKNISLENLNNPIEQVIAQVHAILWRY